MKANGKRTTKRTALTGKQRAFVLAYFANGFVGWRAAQAAGYKGDEAQLRSIASENLTKPNVKREIEARWRRLAMPADEVIGRLTTMASATLADIYTIEPAVDEKTGEPVIDPVTGKQRYHAIIDIADIIQRGQGHLVREVGFNAQGRLEVKIYDAQAALGTLAKYHGLLTERLKLDDWRSEAVAALKDGKITPEGAIDAFGDELARELFALAGVKRE